MSAILSYIPIINWFTQDNNENIEDGNNIKDAPIESMEKSIETIIEIPNSTEHNGVIILYYDCLNKKLFDRINQLNNSVNKIGSTKNIFKWAFGEDKTKKTISLVEQILKLLDIVIRVDNTSRNNPNLLYGQISEYKTTPDLHYQVLRRLKHNQKADTLMRVLYIIEWYFNLRLVDNWEEKLTVSIDNPDLMTVTKKVDKLLLYIKYTDKYRECIHKGIEFRERHYTYLGQGKEVNYLNKEFILDFKYMMEDIFIHLKLYDNFINSLNWFEERRFYEYKETLSGFPTLNCHLNIKTKHVYSPAP